MVKMRILVLLMSVVVVSIFGTAAIMFARGYRLRLDENQVTVSAQGILSLTSNPSGAEVYVNGELKTATDNNISLSPGEYEVMIRKEGFLDWHKTLQIEKEIVTPAHAFLVASAPSLTALTFTGVINPQMTQDFSKIAFIILPDSENGVELNTEGATKSGLWVVELGNLPLGFSRDPRQITDGDLTEATYQWSPDGSEILVTLGDENYLLETTSFTAEVNRVDITKTLDEINENWKAKIEKKLTSQLSNLKDEIESVLKESAEEIRFSPDGDKILYTGKSESTIPEEVVKGLPGSSTQHQERDIKVGKTYVYDIKEDRNFLLGEVGEMVYWLPNSHNLLIPNENRILIKDYDGTNEQVIFSGGYIYPYAFPSNSLDKILVLTSFSSENSNLYWVSLR